MAFFLSFFLVSSSTAYASRGDMDCMRGAGGR